MLDEEIKLQMKIIKKDDKEFPSNFKALVDCPECVYVLGNEKTLNNFSIAIIGSRNCTNIGRVIAEKISRQLANEGINIVSGLAVGIDSVAHKACVNIGKEGCGKTIGILGGGFNNIYPKCNEYLIKQIIYSGGAVLSEYPPNEPPKGYRFRMRNRLIAALARGVVVIEAGEKSGSLITAKFAKQLNKDIFVLPGSVDDENYLRK